MSLLIKRDFLLCWLAAELSFPRTGFFHGLMKELPREFFETRGLLRWQGEELGEKEVFGNVKMGDGKGDTQLVGMRRLGSSSIKMS